MTIVFGSEYPSVIIHSLLVFVSLSLSLVVLVIRRKIIKWAAPFILFHIFRAWLCEQGKYSLWSPPAGLDSTSIGLSQVTSKTGWKSRHKMTSSILFVHPCHLSEKCVLREIPVCLERFQSIRSLGCLTFVVFIVLGSPYPNVTHPMPQMSWSIAGDISSSCRKQETPVSQTLFLLPVTVKLFAFLG